MKKIVLSIFFIIYILITLIVTFFLNKYNSFGMIEINNKLIVTSNKTDMKYRRGDLLIITKDNSNLKENDNVFYYTADKHKILVSKAKITNIEIINEKEKTITLNDSTKYSIEYILGKVDKLVKIPIIGYLLMLLTSKVGYLIAILLPISAFFLLQIYSLLKRKNS